MHDAQFSTTFGRTQARARRLLHSSFRVLTCKPSLLATKTIYPVGEPRPYDNAKQFKFAYREFDCLEDFAKIVL